MVDLTSSGGKTTVWEGNSMNRYRVYDDYYLGNGVNTILTYDQYGFPDKITSLKQSTKIQDWDYDFETTFGNMTSREGLNSPSTYKEETFTFDNQNRLLTYTVGSNTMTLTYDSGDKGNINTKTDVGTYVYNTSYNHRVDEITSPTTLLQNLPQQDISYTKFNKVSTISITDTGLDKDLTVTYGPDQQRIKTVLEDNSSTVLTKYFALGMYEKEVHATEGTKVLLYINTPSGISAILESTSAYDSIFYIHTDILGSYDVITNDQDGVRERLNFDPWGRKRNYSTWDYSSVPTSFKFDRGFTGHEHLDDFCLINMNGRVYDPIIAMFLSPDKYVQSPENTQNFNRYSYCLNNPLIYTDPSGEIIFTVLASVIPGAQFLLPLAISTDIGWMTGGMNSLASGGTFWAGAWKGAVTGAISGATSYLGVPGIIPGGLVQSGASVSVNGITNLLDGDKFFDNWGMAAISGFASGAYNGYKLSDAGGLNYWWGNEVKYGRTQLSFSLQKSLIKLLSGI